MSSLSRFLVILVGLLMGAVAQADELLSDLQELYQLTTRCQEKTEVALRWGMVLRQSPMRSPARRALLEDVYGKALEDCAASSTQAQAIFELGIVAFGEGDFPRAKALFTRLLNEHDEDLLVVDSLYWLAETLSELGDLKRARRAYLGVAERSVGEMRGWGLFKSSRLNKPQKVSVQDLSRLLDLLAISNDVSAKFRRSVSDAFVSDWARASNQVRGALRKTRRWKRLEARDASLLTQAMGRYYISTSDSYAFKSLLVSLKRLKLVGWEFEDRLWNGLLTAGGDWLAWFDAHPQVIIEASSETDGHGRFEHSVDVLEIAIGRSQRSTYSLCESQMKALDSWANTGTQISSSQLIAFLKLHQLSGAEFSGAQQSLKDSVETLVSRCLEERGRDLQCSMAAVPVMLELWRIHRSAIERGVEGSRGSQGGKRLWELLRRRIESRRVVLNREEELASLLGFAVAFKEVDGFVAYASLIPDDFPDPNCELVKALSSVDRADTDAQFWDAASVLFSRLSEKGLSQCRDVATQLRERIEARLDLSRSPQQPLESLIGKHEGKAGLVLVLIENWRRVFEAGDLEGAQVRMDHLLARHGAEREVRLIASEWGDWLERGNKWLRAAEHYRRVAETGGKAIAFYALSKSGRAYRLAGERDLSTTMMRLAQERAIAEMNGSGLEKMCDYWWKQWSQGDEAAASDVGDCHRALLRERLGERCESLSRIWSLPAKVTFSDPRFPNSFEKVQAADCEAAKWEGFLGGVRHVIERLDSKFFEAGADEAEQARYLEELEATRKSYVEAFKPYLSANRSARDALALAYYYGRFHEALYDGLMRLEDPSLGASGAALWRRKLERRGEPLRSIALSAYQKALALRRPSAIHPLESSLQEALLRLEGLSTQPALDYLPLPGEQ